MTSPVADPSIYSNLAGLVALKRDAREQDPTALRTVAKQFESIFAKMMLTSMRKASFGDPIFGSDQQDFYQGMFDDQISMELTKGRGLGLADMLVQQLTRAGLAPASAADIAKDAMASAAKTGATPNAGGIAKNSAPGAQPTTGDLAASIASSIDFRAASARGSLFSFEGSALVDTSGLDGLDSTSALISKMLAAHAANVAESDSGNAASTTFSPGSPEDFVRELWPCAEAAGKELGVDPRHLLAQAALETGWGKALPCDAQGNSSFNLFGIKAGGDWTGNSVSVRTLEFEGGVPVPRQARFRAYASAADSFRDYVSVLRDNPRYAGALNTGSNTHAFTQALQRGGYATDPAYARKIDAIVKNLDATPSVNGLKSSDVPPISSLSTL